MSNVQLDLAVFTERPVLRNDQPTEIDIAIDVTTSRSLAAESSRFAVNLCVVIDRSGSMYGDKLEQAKRSCVEIFKSLNPDDLFTVLAFDHLVLRVVNPQTPKDSVIEHIMGLNSGGETDLSKGWYLGLSELQTYSTERHINRIILLSDGQANQGEQKPSVLGSESARARDQLGITTSTIGIGDGFQEDLLAAIARESGGRFWFIGDAGIEAIIKEEFSGALSVYLERPKIGITLPSGVKIARELNQIPKIAELYRVRPIKANDHLDFALRLSVDPTNQSRSDLPICVTLYDGTEVVQSTEISLPLASAEEFVRSPQDDRVAVTVRKFQVATSDEEMLEAMGTGDVTTMLDMLQNQSDLMKELEAKLAGAAAYSLEDLEAQQKEAERVELQRMHEAMQRELAELRMQLGENDAMMAVGQLINLMQGLGLSREAFHLISMSQKMHMHRGMRHYNLSARGEMDDFAPNILLHGALETTQELTRRYPELREDLQTIENQLRESLEKFS